MAQTLGLSGFSTNNILARTKISGDIASGVSSIPVVNSNDFKAGPLLVGAPGSSNPEILTATAPSSSIAISTGET